jgi:hypothetical protein
MAVAALGAWILTAACGSYLLSSWLPGGILRGNWGLPGLLLYGHILLAAAGLASWVGYLVTDNARAGWGAFGALSVVAGVGYIRFVQWLPKYGQHADRHSVAGSPAAREFPFGAVLLHGMCAAVTIALVLVALLGA